MAIALFAGLVSTIGLFVMAKVWPIISRRLKEVAETEPEKIKQEPYVSNSGKLKDSPIHWNALEQLKRNFNSVEDVEKTFKSWDSNNDGTISFTELQVKYLQFKLSNIYHKNIIVV